MKALRLIVGAVIFLSATVVAQRAPAPPRPSAEQERAALAARVRTEFQHAWTSYTRLASGHDEVNPLTRTVHDWYPPAVLYMTPIDALDTMQLMGLNDEAASVRALLLDKLTFDLDTRVQVFEVNIRILGGLLTAFQMSGEPKFLTLAEDLGKRLLPAFQTPTGMPYRYVNLRTGKADDAVSNPAEIGTLILEFGTLSRLTGRPIYYDAAKKAIVELWKRRDPTTNLLGEGIDVTTGMWTNTSSHIGGGIDSYYEYVLKCERLFDDADCGTMWRAGVAAVNRYLADDGPTGLWYGVSDMKTGRRTQTRYGSLQAFLPAVLALGGDVTSAARLQDSGFRMWNLNGIEPEEYDYRKNQITDARYVLRPEIIESAYYLYHYTRDPKYLEMGRTFFEDLVKYCRTDDGYTTLKSVKDKSKGDRQHSFLLAETLKYLYLLFEPEAVNFDRVTFNTEAHPIVRTW
jgi:ER degradation enhancer, mannosidase alpha-like 2